MKIGKGEIWRSIIVVLFFIIFIWMIMKRDEVDEHFLLNPKNKKNINPFLTIPEEMITWKPFSMNMETQPNYSAYFYRNTYMYPIY